MTQDPVSGHRPQPDRDAPAVRASDAEREATGTRLQTAVGEGRIDRDEFGQRVEAAYAAASTADLDRLLADLPAPASAVTAGGEIIGERGTKGRVVSPAVGEIIGERATTEPLFSLLGDVRLTATTAVPTQVVTVLGDVKIDLRGLRTSASTIELRLYTFLGDVEVIVSEGVAAEIGGWTLLGNRTTELAAVPRLP